MTKVIDGTIGAVSEVGSGRGVKRLLRRIEDRDDGGDGSDEYRGEACESF